MKEVRRKITISKIIVELKLHVFILIVLFITFPAKCILSIITSESRLVYILLLAQVSK